MKYLILTCLLASAGRVVSQDTNALNDSVISKWCKAIVNLDCRPSKNLLPENYTPAYKIGSAVFLEYENEYYLVSVRHVLEDKDEINAAFTKDPDPICYKIFAVPRGDTVAKFPEGIDENLVLLNLGDGMPGQRPYIFSSGVDDIAVISLRRQKLFVEALLAKGYEPVTVDDIDIDCAIVGDQKIAAFGFPGDMFETGKQGNITLGQFASRSPVASLPVITEGTIGDVREGRSSFTGNIFVTKGSSGGPIVSENKLVGIVSRQVTVYKDYYKKRELHFIKSSLIMPLVEKLHLQNR